MLGRTLSFEDASVNVALSPSTSLGASPGQSHVFLRSIEPALHLVKIRKLLSSAYHDMYYSGRLTSPTPILSTWTLCQRICEWYADVPEHNPRHLSVLFRLEMLYTTITILSPSHRYPEPCDYNKAVLFDRCMRYIGELHPALSDTSVLPSITFIDIQRVYQVGRRFVELLTRNYDLLMDPSRPVPPRMSAEGPEPPALDGEGWVDCHSRSIQCLAHVQHLLQYCMTKWGMGAMLEEFERMSAPIQKHLIENPGAYFNGPVAYVGESTLPAAGSGYPAHRR